MKVDYKVSKYRSGMCVEILENVESRDLLMQMVKDKQDDALSTVPLTALQEMDQSFVKIGRYYGQIMDEDTSIGVLVSPTSVGFTTKKLVGNEPHIKNLYYEFLENRITFKWVINKPNKSTYYAKLYQNIDVYEVENQKFTPEELEKGINDILEEIEYFDGINELVDTQKLRENIIKYLAKERK